MYHAASLGEARVAAACGDDEEHDPVEIPPGCGDGVRSGAEECDGVDVARQSCRSLGFEGGTLRCTQTCGFDTGSCEGSGPTCGDGVAGGSEACDGADLRTLTCRTLGYESPPDAVPTCTSRCELDTSTCSGAPPVCGDNNAEGVEECDGFDLRGLRCSSLGFEGGRLACDTSCRLSVRDCSGGEPTSCGDGIVNGDEFCDATELAGQTCSSLGYTGGELGCRDRCEFDVSQCNGTGPMCGNDVREGLEACDGTSTLTCTALGLGGETASCDASCTADASDCEAPQCGDGALNQAEESCDGIDTGGQSCTDFGYDGGEPRCGVDCQTLVFSSCDGGPTPVCGNGTVEPGEMCDGDNRGFYDCAFVELGPGTIGCTDACFIDMSACASGSAGTCGNGIVEEGEQCDGTQSESCSDVLDATGPLGCLDNCAYDFGNCSPN